jgi:Tol biopolymer transport system component
MPKKKIFFIFLGLFILASASLVIYNFVLKNGDGPGKRSADLLAPDQPLKIKNINKERSFALAIGQDGQTIKYYLKDNGHVFTSQFNGSQPQPISSSDLSGLFKILWSPDGEKVIGFFNSQGPVKKYFYDYQTKENSLLSENIKSVAWSPDGEKIAYQYQSADGQFNNISLADPNGGNWRILFQTRLENLEIFWPSPDKIYVFNKPSGHTLSSLFAVDPDSGSLNKIISDQFGLAAKWSPDGQKMIYQKTEQKGKNLKLFVAQADGSQAQPLPVTTLVEKCVWSENSETVFCAVPQQLSESATWPDDYNLKRIGLKDDFYLIETTGQKEIKIAQSDDGQSFDASELVLSPQEDYLFFINRWDELIYRIDLVLP